MFRKLFFRCWQRLTRFGDDLLALPSRWHTWLQERLRASAGRRRRSAQLFLEKLEERLTPSAEPTSTTLSAVSTWLTYGQQLSLTAQVSSDQGPPSGSVEFLEDGILLATSSLDASGIATFQSSSLAANSATSFAADFVGNDDWDPSNSASLGVTINPATLTITPTAGQSKIYGAADPVYTYSPSGFVNGDSSSLLTGALDRDIGEDVGSYAIILGSLDAGPNYILSLDSADFSITPAPLTISAVSDSKTYDTFTTSLLVPTVRGLASWDTMGGMDQAFTSPNVLGTNGSTLTVIDYTLDDPSNYSISLVSAPGTITPAPLTISASTDSKQYDGTMTSPTPSPSVNGLLGSDTVPQITQAFTSPDVLGLDGSTLQITGYIVNDGNGGKNYAVNTATARGTITPASLTITAKDVSGVYGSISLDGSTGFTVSGLLNGDTIGSVTLSTNATLSGSGNANVGLWTITPSAATGGTFVPGNYAIDYDSTGSLSVTQRSLTILPTAQDRSYDGTSSASVALSDDRITGDQLTASYSWAYFLDPNAGTNKTVVVSGLSLAGPDSGDYTIAADPVTTTADITPVNLTITANDVNGVYGSISLDDSTGFTVSGLVNGETVDLVALSTNATTSGSGNTSAGTWTITPSAASGSSFDPNNYSIRYDTGSLSVTQRLLTITASAQDKSYDGTSSASVALSDDRITGDQFTAGYTTAAFADANVGTGKTVTVSGLSLAGPDSGDYTATDPVTTTADITPAPLTITASDVSGVYGSISLDDSTGFTVWGLQNGETVDSVTLSTNATTSSSGNTSAGTWTITPSAASGTFDPNNYAISYLTGTLSVTPRLLTIMATADDKSYDGTSSVTITSLSDDRIAGDQLTASYTTAAFADPNVGTGKTVTLSGLSLAGPDSGDYAAADPVTTTADITPAPLTITTSDVSGVYGSISLDDSTGFTVSGLVNGETVDSVALSTNATTSGSGNTSAGTWTITPSAASGSSFDPNNYAIRYNTGILSVTPRSLTITATGQDKSYDSTSSATAWLSDDRIAGDSFTASYTTAAFADPNVGTYKTVTVSGLSLAGPDSGDYTIAADPVFATASITPANLTITAKDQSKFLGALFRFAGTEFTSSGLLGSDSVSSVSLSSTGASADAGAGSYPITASDASGTGLSNYDISYVAGTLTVTEASLSTQEGQQATLTLASFTLLAGTTAADYSARIDWGDGSSGSGQIVDNDDGTFQVMASHAYAEDGQPSLTVTLTASGSSQTIPVLVTVTDAPISGSNTEAAPQSISAVEGTPLNNVVLATWSDPDGHTSYSAVVDWGDGSATEEQDNLPSSGSLQGSHTYSQAGSYLLSVTLSADRHGNQTTLPPLLSTVVVAEAPLTPHNVALTAEQGVPGLAVAGSTPPQPTATVATFSDANHDADASSFLAQIDWGDGSGVSQAVVAGSGGSFQVDAPDHAYALAGVYTLTCRFSDADGSNPHDVFDTVTVAPESNAAELSITPVPLAVPAGGATTPQTLATFSTIDLDLTNSDFSARIAWGDGSTSTGTIQQLGDGLFSVQGEHHYARAGDYPVQVSVSGPDDTQVAGTTAKVVDAALSLTGQVATLPPQLEVANLLLASLTDPNLEAQAGDFAATIDWGDGSAPEAGEVVGSGGSFWVRGTHTYAQPGSYSATVRVSDHADADGLEQAWDSTTTTLTVLDGVEGQTWGANQTLAWLDDSNPLANQATDDYSATIDWGDGSAVEDAGAGGTDQQVTPVSASASGHVYAEPGSYTVTVSMADDDNASVSVNQTVQIADQPLSDQGAGPLWALAGGSLSAVVAQFRDGNATSSSDDFLTTINWGDGTSSTGTVTEDPSTGLFQVEGTHPYAAAGDYTIVTLTQDQDSGLTLVSTTALQVAAVGLIAPLPAASQADLQTLGEAQLDLDRGGVRISEPLDLAQSDAARASGSFALVYNSLSVNTLQPQLSVPADPYQGFTGLIEATLTFDGHNQPTVFIDPSAYPAGGPYPLPALATFPGTHSWQLVVNVTLADGSSRSGTASGTLVSADRTASPYGAGWGIDGLDQLLLLPSGVLWLSGAGDSRLFSRNEDGSYTSPDNDFGSLVQKEDGSFAYTAKDQTLYRFNAEGLCISRALPSGLAWNFSYDEQGRLEQVMAPDGSISTFDYTDGWLTSIEEPSTLPSRRSVALTHEPAGNVVAIEDADLEMRSLGYDEAHRLVSDAWDPYASSFSYSSSSGLLNGVALGSVQTYTILAQRDPSNSGAASLTDGLDHTTLFAFNDAGYLLGQIEPDGSTQLWAVDSHGNITAYTDADGNTTRYVYVYGPYDPVLGGGDGDLVETINPDGSTVVNSYDPIYHQVTSTTDEDGNVTTYDYDLHTGELLNTTTAAGTAAAATTTQVWTGPLLLHVTDPDGNTTFYDYNDLMQLVGQQSYDSSGVLMDSEVFTYDDYGHQANQTVGAGGPAPVTNSSNYDGLGQLFSQTDTDGNVSSTTYLAAGFVSSSTDADGTITQYAYNAAGEQTAETDDANTSVPETMGDSYDGAGNLVSSTDPDGNLTVNVYDSANRLLASSTYDVSGNLINYTASTYDRVGNVLTSTDGDGNVTSNSYDRENRLLTQTVTDADGNLISSAAYTYDKAGNVLTSTDGDGNVTAYSYDGTGNVLTQTVTDAGGIVTSFAASTYDKNGNVLTSTDAYGTVTGNSYDGENRLLTQTVTDADGVVLSISHSSYALNGEDGPDSDGDGNTTTETYDAAGNMLTQTVTDPDGNLVSFAAYSYDKNGNVLTMTDGDGNVTAYTYDGNGNVLTQTVTDADGNLTSYAAYTYDKAGNVLTSTDGDGNVTTNTWDGNELVGSVLTDYFGNVIQVVQGTTTYDKNGNILSSVDGDGNTTTNVWDGNQLQSSTVTDYFGNIVSSAAYTYDKAGNVLTMTDGDGNVTTNTWDGNELVKSVLTDYFGNVIQVVQGSTIYDKNGNILSSVDGDGNVTTNVWDGNQLQSSTVTDYFGNVLSAVAYTYDKAGNVLTTTDGDGNVTTNTWDGNQLQSSIVTDYFGNSVSSVAYTYDKAGNILTQTDGDGNVTTNTWGGNELVKTVLTDYFGTIIQVVQGTITYDKNGNILTSTDRDGNVTTNTWDGNQLQSSTVTDYFGNVISAVAYTYDKAGNILTSTDGDGNVTTNTWDGNQLVRTVVQDPNGKIISDTGTTTYDKNGNVLTSVDVSGNLTSNVWDGNQLQMSTVTDADGNLISFVGYTYDKAGNVLTTTDGDGNVTTNTWDGNELVQSVLTDYFGNVVQVVQGNTIYDKNGNVLSSVDGDGNTTTNVWDGNQLQSSTVTDYFGTIISDVAYTYDKAGNVLTMTDGDGNVTTNTWDGNELVQSVLTDYFGNVIQVVQGTTTYDKNGNVLSSVDGDGNTNTNTWDGNQLQGSTVTDYFGNIVSSVAYTYDKAGNVLTQTDGNGNVTTNTWDGNQLQSSTVTDADGNVTSYAAYTYDKAGNVLTTTDGDGNVTTNTWDGNELVQSVLTDYFGTVIQVVQGTTTYDKNGNVLSSVDGDGNTTTNTWDGTQLQSSTVTDYFGNIVSDVAYTYDKAGNILTQTDGDGNVTTNTWDGNQLVRTVVKDAAGTVLSDTGISTYDRNGNVLTSTDAYGNTTTNTWDGNQLQSSTVTDYFGNIDSDIAYTYDKGGNVLTQTDGDGNVTTNTYDGSQLVKSVLTDSSGTVVQVVQGATTYDKNGNVLTSVDGDGNVTTNVWDGNQLQSSTVTDYFGNVISDIAYTYDKNGNIFTQTDGDGNVTSNTWDGNQLVRTVVKDSSGTIISDTGTTTYDDNGNVLTSVDPYGNLTTNVWDGNQLQSTRLTDADGNLISSAAYTYDKAGNLLTSTDGDGNVTTNTWDGNELVKSVLTDSSGTLLQVVQGTTTYDKNGNILTSTDGDGNVTTNTWEGNRLLGTVVSSAAGVVVSSVSYAYDENGNILTTTDGDGNVTSNTWDGNLLVGVVVRDVQGTLVRSQSFAYDKNGNQVSSSTTGGDSISSTYDGNQLVSQTWYAPNGAVTNNLSWSYDSAGNLVSASSDAGSYTMSYAGNRLVTQTSPSGVTLTYGYDLNDNVISLADSQGGLTGMTYNGLGQVITKTYQDSTNRLRVDYTYDDNGNVLTETRYSDLAGTNKVGFTQYGYAGNLVTSIVNEDGSGTVLSSYSYSYDTADRLISQTANGTETDYTYDAAGELTKAGTQTYSYDTNGNRTGTGYDIGPDNELSTDGTWDYSYDTAGNLISQTNIIDGTSRTYSYDAMNEMVGAVEAGSDDTVMLQVSYVYDVFGSRISETVVVPPDVGPLEYGSTITTGYVYTQDGPLYATLDDSGNIQTRYVSDVQGANHWEAQITSTSVQWLLGDDQGSVVDVVDNSGTVLDPISYDATGNIISQGNDSYQPDVLFQGMQIDTATGQYIDTQGNIGRILQTTTDRFNQQDPAQQGTNWYEGMGNAPTDYTDPTGRVLFAPDKETAEGYDKVLKGLGASTVDTEPVGKRYAFVFSNMSEIRDAIGRTKDETGKAALQALIADTEVNKSVVRTSGGKYALEKTDISPEELSNLSAIRENAIQDYQVRHPGNIPAQSETPFGRYEVPDAPKRVFVQKPRTLDDQIALVAAQHPDWERSRVLAEAYVNLADAERMANDRQYRKAVLEQRAALAGLHLDNSEPLLAYLVDKDGNAHLIGLSTANQVQQLKIAEQEGEASSRWTRPIAFIGLLGSIAEMAGGLYYSVQTGGIGGVAGGGLLMAHGGDGAITNLQTLWSGNPHQTALRMYVVGPLVEKAGGSEKTADKINLGIDLAFSLASFKPSGNMSNFLRGATQGRTFSFSVSSGVQLYANGTAAVATRTIDLTATATHVFTNTAQLVEIGKVAGVANPVRLVFVSMMASGTPARLFDQSNWSWRAPKEPSDVHPDLPVYKENDPTVGRFEANGEYAWLRSQTKGPGEKYAGLAGLSRDAKIALTHAEGHAAAIMREAGPALKEATIFINKPGGPCGFCFKGIGEILLEGQRLYVRFPGFSKGKVGLGYFEHGNPRFVFLDRP